MEITVQAFGIARDILGDRQKVIDLQEPATVGQLLQTLQSSYPAFTKLTSLAVALNEEYASNDDPLKSTDAVALIPPVSGG